jgi:hypothetical protein
LKIKFVGALLLIRSMIGSLFMKAKNGRETARRKKCAGELKDDLENQEPMLKGQIRESIQQYRRGEKRDAGAFLSELRRKLARPNTKRKT